MLQKIKELFESGYVCLERTSFIMVNPHEKSPVILKFTKDDDIQEVKVENKDIQAVQLLFEQHGQIPL